MPRIRTAAIKISGVYSGATGCRKDRRVLKRLSGVLSPEALTCVTGTVTGRSLRTEDPGLQIGNCYVLLGRRFSGSLRCRCSRSSCCFCLRTIVIKDDIANEVLGGFCRFFFNGHDDAVFLIVFRF